MSKRIAVLMGGTSGEREVSLVSGRACAAALRETGHSVDEIVVSNDVAALIGALAPPPDAVFNALHGRWGEDGCIQGVLELLRIPYTHSGVMASALAMNKAMAKRIFAAAGIVCPEGVVVSREVLLKREVMERPYVIKPVCEGSSLGVRIVQAGDNAPPLEPGGWPFPGDVMVERFIPGRELTVAVMGDQALAVTELRPRRGFYDYEAKYTEGKTEHLVPAPLSQGIYDQALEVAAKAHRLLGCRGVSRADFRLDDTQGEPGELYLLEVNTQPGMTPLSLVPEQAAHAGVSFAELCAWLVEEAACDA
jgi:D-alanine-D-alanine ligase